MQRTRRKKSERRLRISLYSLAFLVIVIDQVTKAAVLKLFSHEGLHSIPVIENIFHLSFVRNPGIAFGMFQKSGLSVTLAIFVCVMMLLVVSLRLRFAERNYQSAYAMVLGGALSNFIDRLRFGYVIDFLDFQVWPVFNVADSAITIGILFLMAFTLMED